jgi:hypothetical protein
LLLCAFTVNVTAAFDLSFLVKATNDNEVATMTTAKMIFFIFFNVLDY